MDRPALPPSATAVPVDGSAGVNETGDAAPPTRQERIESVLSGSFAPESSLSGAQARAIELLRLLPSEEQAVICLATGMYSGGPYTDEEIGRALDIPRSTCNWLKRKALATLKTQMRGLS